MKEREQLLSHLKQMSDGFVLLFGKTCEVCIHDLNDLQHSLVHVSGNVTGRVIGAPATDLLVKRLNAPVDQIKDLHNYRSVSGDGRTLKSSTLFIKDSQGTPVFAVCINLDTTDFFNANQLLSSFLATEDSSSFNEALETFSHSVAETIEALFGQALLEMGKQPASMSTEEKTALVELLENNGAFQFKGAVEQIALLIGVSKYTIYNYLKKIHARQAINHPN